MQRKEVLKVEKIKIKCFAVWMHQSRTFCVLPVVRCKLLIFAWGRSQNELEPHFIFADKLSHVSKICQKTAFYYCNQSYSVLEIKSRHSGLFSDLCIVGKNQLVGRPIGSAEFLSSLRRACVQPWKHWRSPFLYPQRPKDSVCRWLLCPLDRASLCSAFNKGAKVAVPKAAKQEGVPWS